MWFVWGSFYSYTLFPMLFLLILFFQMVHALLQFRQILKHSLRFEKIFKWKGRGADPIGSGFFNGLGYAGLCANSAAVCNADMANKSGLTAYLAVFTNSGAARNSGLGCYYGIRTDFGIMRHLYEVVQLYAVSDKSASHGGAVYGAIGADLHIIFY